MTLADLSNSQYSFLVLICLAIGYLVLWSIQSLNEDDAKKPSPFPGPTRARDFGGVTTEASHETATYRSRPSRRTGSGPAVKTAQKIARNRLRLIWPPVPRSADRARLSTHRHRHDA